MTEEEKKAISQCYLLLNGEITLHIIDDDGGTAYSGVVNKDYNKDLETVLNLIQKQDTEINSLKETIQKQEKSREHLKKQLKGEIAVKDTEINKLNNVIDKLVEELRYEVGMGQDSIFCNNICNYYKENCKEEKCRKCIKEYFMKEDK